MNKFVYFMAVALAFTVLQVATVEADMIPGTTGDDTHPCGALTGDALIKCTEENPPPSGTSAAGGPPTLTLEDPRCQLAPADRDPGCPVMPGTAPMAPPMCGDQPCPAPTGDHPPGEHHDGPPSGTSEAGGPPALTIGDPKCIVGAAHRDPGCPNFGQP